MLNDWPHKKLIDDLHVWTDRFNETNGLCIDTPVIRIGEVPRGGFGAYRQGRNDLGMMHEISLSVNHIKRPLACLLMTFLHLLLHLWQETHGKPSSRKDYHNRELQFKAREVGLVIDRRGHTEAIPNGPFVSLLVQHGVDPSPLFEAPKRRIHVPRRRGKSRLKKWSCGCTNVWAAVEPRLQCLKCGEMLHPASLGW